MTEEVIRVLRERILLGQYVGRLPAERALCDELEASRSCIRVGLERLSTEGLVYPVAGRRWQITNVSERASFELIVNSLEGLGHEGFIARVDNLLDYRARHFVASVAWMVDHLVEPSDASLSALGDLGVGLDKHYADKILADEDAAMIELVTSKVLLADHLVAHQIRRAMAKLREHLQLDFYLRHLTARFNPLFEAIGTRDRERALLFAEEVAKGRDELYRRLAEEATRPNEPPKARYVFGEN